MSLSNKISQILRDMSVILVSSRVAVSWDALGSRLHRLSLRCWGVLTSGHGFFQLQFWLFSFYRCWNQGSWYLLLISNRCLGNTRLLCKMVLVLSQQSSIFQLNYKQSWTNPLFQNSSSEVAWVKCFSYQHDVFFLACQPCAYF